MKITEVADLLGVSRKTIYRRIDSLKLEDSGQVHRVGKDKIVSLQGVELIRGTIDSGQAPLSIVRDSDPTFESSIIKQYERLMEIESRTTQRTIEDLRATILEKNELIVNLQKSNDRLMQMQENSQVLLVREQERTLLLEENKGFWSKFKKK